MFKKILVIDKEETAYKLKELLRTTYDVVVATDKLEAIATFRTIRRSLSLILVNPMLDSSDMSFITDIYRLNPRDVIPIIAVYSPQMDEYISDILRFGVFDVVREPFQAEVIKVRLRNAITLYEMKNRMVMDDLVRRSPVASIGKAVEILEYEASHDGLTDLLNQTYSKREVTYKITHDPMSNYALVILDLDNFKDANDKYGHLFGDQVLQHVANKLKACVRRNDLICRVGGDEFLLLIQYKVNIEAAVSRIFHTLIGEYKGFKISLSMGVAKTEREGNDYERLFSCADRALYAAKKSGRGCYKFYDESMKDTLSVISPIDNQ